MVQDAGSTDGGAEPEQCLENTLEMVRQNAIENNNDDPLCFKLSTIFDWGLSAQSEEICMYRCSWEEDCNWYMNIPDDEF
jgi:hypothetical protein